MWAWNQVASTLPSPSNGWRWSPAGQENGIGWRSDRPSQLKYRHMWHLVLLHPVLSDKLLEWTRFHVRLALDGTELPPSPAIDVVESHVSSGFHQKRLRA